MSLFFCSLKGIDTQSGKYQKHLISARNHSASARSASERGGDAGAVASRCPIGLTLLAAAGLMLVVQPWSPDSTAVSKLLATAAGLSWAGSVIIANRLYAKHEVSMLSVTLWQLVFSIMPPAAIAWVAHEPPVTWNLEFLVILLFSGALCSGLGWLMWMYLLQRIPASTLSLTSLVIPVLAAIASWIQFGERPQSLEMVGMLIIGVALATMSLYSIWKAQRLQVREAD